MNTIRNRAFLETSSNRKAVLDLLEAGIASVLPERVLEESLSFDSKSRLLIVNGDRVPISGRLFVVGGGKAGSRMAASFEEIVGLESISAGIVNTREKLRASQSIDVREAGSPIPDLRGAAGVEAMLKLKHQYDIGAKDVVICLISGGGSALLPLPIEGISLEDLRQTTSQLLECGATIQEINVVRKHLSQIKGGRLGQFFAPAMVVSLIISDVVGNDLGSIASGLTAADPSTFGNSLSVVEKYDMSDTLPKSVIRVLESGMAGRIPETPERLDNCRNLILAENRTALDAMKLCAEELGLHPVIITSEQTGDPGQASAIRADDVLNSRYPDADVLLFGGETTPVLPQDHGKGGRNQQLAAEFMLRMKEYHRPWAMASMGTDGSDFISEAAGAIVDQNSYVSMVSKGLDVEAFVGRYDAYHLFFEIENALIQTGNTGTNVCDIGVILRGTGLRN